MISLPLEYTALSQRLWNAKLETPLSILQGEWVACTVNHSQLLGTYPGDLIGAGCLVTQAEVVTLALALLACLCIKLGCYITSYSCSLGHF